MLFFEGRIDNQIKLHGYRIELADVEANLRALSGSAMPWSYPSSSRGPSIPSPPS